MWLGLRSQARLRLHMLWVLAQRGRPPLSVSPQGGADSFVGMLGLGVVEPGARAWGRGWTPGAVDARCLVGQSCSDRVDPVAATGCCLLHPPPPPATLLARLTSGFAARRLPPFTSTQTQLELP